MEKITSEKITPTKEQALEYIKKRYPNQTLIYDEYLKPPVVMVIKK